jgi:beta-lactamase regulating signal transducer with metallopeptidase domain
VTSLIAGTLDAVVILAAALALTAVLRQRSAALRHSVLAAAMLAAAAAPALEVVLPEMRLLRSPAHTVELSSAAPLSSEVVANGAGLVAITARPQPVFSWKVLLLMVWASGVALLAAGLVVGFVRIGRLAARCRSLGDGPWRSMADDLTAAAGLRRRVHVLLGPATSPVITYGALRPTIILPSDAEAWPAERRRIVLVHELEHVRRHDGAVHLAAELIRAIYWFNPLVTVVCRQLRQESEYACDDAVLRDGVQATEYAGHLLAIATTASAVPAWASASAIARPSTLERRISTMLTHRHRRPVTRRMWVAVAAATVAIVLPVTAASLSPATDPTPATIKRDISLVPQPLQRLAPEAAVPTTPLASPTQPNMPTASAARRVPLSRPAVVTTNAVAPAPAPVEVVQAPSFISGTVVDQTGASMPGARLSLVSDDGNTQSVVTNPEGRFVFNALRPARYILMASLSGFAAVSQEITLTPGTGAQPVIILPLGTLEESVTVTCGGGVAAMWNRAWDALIPTLSAQGAPGGVSPVPRPRPIRVGGDIKVPRKVAGAAPTCPATNMRAMGTVTLFARIAADGTVGGVTALAAPAGTEPPAEFVQATIDAVRQWVFSPAALNGQAVPVNMTVRVSFNGR